MYSFYSNSNAILRFDVTVAYKQAFNWFSWATTCVRHHLLGYRRHKHFHLANALGMINRDNHNEQVSHKLKYFSSIL